MRRCYVRKLSLSRTKESDGICGKYAGLPPLDLVISFRCDEQLHARPVRIISCACHGTFPMDYGHSHDPGSWPPSHGLISLVWPLLNSATDRLRARHSTAARQDAIVTTLLKLRQFCCRLVEIRAVGRRRQVIFRDVVPNSSTSLRYRNRKQYTYHAQRLAPREYAAYSRTARPAKPRIVRLA